MESLTLEQMSYLAEIIGVIAVVISLLYMSIQLRQNTDAIKLGTSHAVTEEFRGMFSLISSNQGILDSLVVAAQEPFKLSGAEKGRYYTFTNNLVLAYQNAFMQMNKGILEKEHWEGMNRMMIDYTSTPGFKDFWQNRKHWTSNSFQEFMDTQVIPTTQKKGVSLPGGY